VSTSEIEEPSAGDEVLADLVREVLGKAMPVRAGMVFVSLLIAVTMQSSIRCSNAT